MFKSLTAIALLSYIVKYMIFYMSHYT